MANNEAPTEPEVEEMVELYGEYNSYKDVASDDAVEWSRPTVTKWIKRVREMAELFEELGSFPAVADHDDVVWGAEAAQNLIETWEAHCVDGLLEPDTEVDPMSAGPNDEQREEPDGDYTADSPTEQMDGVDTAVVGGDNSNTEEVPPKEKYADVLEDKPDSPNEVLLNVLEAEPNIDGDHIGYIRSQLEYRGMMSPEEVVALMDDMSISSKNKTIARVRRDYNQRLNQVMRENDDIAQHDDWATYLTKITGDPAYVQDSPNPTGGGAETIQIPPNQQPGGQQGGQRAVPAPSPSGSGAQTGHPQPGQQQQARQPQPQQGGRGQQARTVPTNQTGQPTSPNEAVMERLIDRLDRLEEKVDDGDPEPTPQPEPSDPASVMEEMMEMQEKMQQLQQMAGGTEDSGGTEVEQMVSLLDQRLDQLQQEISNNDPQPQAGVQNLGGSSDSMMAEIARVADTVDDPELLSMLIEMQTDSDVLEAKAKLNEAESDRAWKETLAESLSPAAAEKAIDAFSSVLGTLNQGAQAAGQPRQRQPAQGQPTQAAQPAQPAQQGQPAQQPQQGGGQRVERVEEEAAEQDQAGNPSKASPLREEGEAELQAAEEVEAGESEAEAESAEDVEGDQ